MSTPPPPGYRKVPSPIWPFEPHDVMFDVAPEALRDSRLFWVFFWPALSLLTGMTALYFATTLNAFGLAPEEINHDAVFRSYYALLMASEIGFLWWFASWLKSRQLAAAVFDIRPARFGIETGYGLVLFGMSFIFAIAAVDMLLPLLPVPDVPTPDRFNGGGLTGTLLVAASVIIFAPLVEEIIMRGWLLPKLAARMGGWIWPILLSAGGFGLMHILVDVPTMIYATVLGIFAGLARRLTGRLWAPIVLHFVNNLVASLSF
jgi:membrane protease YdiL (CAAX protease family)